MPDFKIVVNDSKTGKSYQKVVQDEGLSGKKIHDKIDGKLLGLHGYELEITGGSNLAGFPMRQDVDGIGRRKILIVKGTGLRKTLKGTRYKKSVVGNTIGSKTAQINVKVVKFGVKSIEESFGIKKEEPIDVKEEHHKAESHKTEHKLEHVSEVKDKEVK